MTSPSQLKYLDAMGIPVWVSRELIIENSEKVEESSAGRESSTRIESSIKTNNTVVSQQTTKSHSLNKSDGSAQSIIDSLTQTNSSITNLAPVEESHNASVPDSRNNADNRHSAIENSVQDTVDISVANSIDNKVINPVERMSSTPERSISEDSTNLFNKSISTPHHHVYTSGSEVADWMIIGHSPESFNTVGDEPFGDKAGELLNNMLRAVGIDDPRKHAYFINVFDINDPAVISEGATASQRLLNQNIVLMINRVKPKVILLVGQIAAQNLLDNKDPLIIMRSKVHQLTELNIPSIVTYYPSYLLHKPIDKRKVWEDLKLAMKQIH